MAETAKLRQINAIFSNNPCAVIVSYWKSFRNSSTKLHSMQNNGTIFCVTCDNKRYKNINNNEIANAILSV